MIDNTDDRLDIVDDKEIDTYIDKQMIEIERDKEIGDKDRYKQRYR